MNGVQIPVDEERLLMHGDIVSFGGPTNVRASAPVRHELAQSSTHRPRAQVMRAGVSMRNPFRYIYDVNLPIFDFAGLHVRARARARAFACARARVSAPLCAPSDRVHTGRIGGFY